MEDGLDLSAASRARAADSDLRSGVADGVRGMLDALRSLDGGVVSLSQFDLDSCGS